MVETPERISELGRVFCSVSVQAVLADAGVTPAELLQHHRRAEDAEAAAKPDWKCTSFDLERSQQTVWIITDPQEQSTMLLLQEP